MHGQQRLGTNGVLTQTVMPPREQRQAMTEMALVDWVFMSLKPFATIESDAFLKWGGMMNPDIALTSRRTVIRRILKASGNLKAQMK